MSKEAGSSCGVAQRMHVDTCNLTMQELRQMALKRAELTAADVEQQIEDRAAARKAKDFAEADAVRARLAAKGILMMDTPQGTSWRPGVQELPS